MTEEQKKIIESSSKERIINASAGTGKTYTMVEAFYQVLVEEKFDISGFLVLTFTEKAALEMKKRIYEKIKKDSSENIFRVNFDIASISTIHSFCRRIIAENFNCAGVDPNFSVITEAMSKILVNEAAQEVMEEYMSNLDKSQKLLELAHNFSLDEIKQYAMQLLAQFRAHTGLKDIKDIFELYSDPAEHLLRFKYFFDGIYQAVLEMEEAIKQNGLEGILSEMRGIHDEIAGCYLKNEFLRMYNAVYAWTKPDYRKKGFNKARALKPLTDFFNEEYRKKIKYEITDEKELTGSLDIARLLFEMALLINEKYSAKKELLNALDYADLELYAHDILSRNPAVRTSYENRFRHVFIDEFQDTNFIQNEILSLLSVKARLFIVGDVKQSIFRFREACPEIFRERLNSGERMALTGNFRSAECVVDFVNRVCEPDFMSSAEIRYNAENRLIYKRTEKPEGKNCSGVFIYEPEQSITKEEQALLVAENIKEIVDNPAYLIEEKGSCPARKIRYQDIAVLVRKNAYLEILAAALEKLSIPYSLCADTGIFSSIEARDALSLMSAADNPSHDIELAASMKSSFGNFTDNEIFMLKKSSGRGVSLYRAVMSFMEAGPAENIGLYGKAERFIELLRDLRVKAGRLYLSEFVLHIINLDDFHLKNLIYKNGKSRYKNLIRIYNIAKEFEKNIANDLHLFIRYVKNIEAGAFDSGSEADMPGESGGVNLMTEHKSKGLEFPVVFLPFKERRTGGGRNSTPDFMEYGRGRGMYFYFIDRRRRIRRKSLLYSLLEAENLRKDKEEEYRLIYVSLTRARDWLFIYSGEPRGEQKEDKAPSTEYECIVRNLSGLIPAKAGIYCCNRLHVKPEMTEGGVFLSKKSNPYENYISGLKRIEMPDESTDKQELSHIDRKYSFLPLCSIKSKLVATEIAAAAVPEEDYSAGFPLGAFSKDRDSAREKGIDAHRLFQSIDFGSLKDEAYLKEYFAKMASLRRTKLLEYGEFRDYISCMNESLTFGYASAVTPENIYREQSFSYKLQPGINGVQFPSSAQSFVIVQGKIDLMIKTAAGIVITDYKTELFCREDEKRMEKYRVQASVYSAAVKSICGAHPLKIYLLFLKNGFEIDVSECQDIF